MKQLLLAFALIACHSSSTTTPISHKPSDTGAVDEATFKAMHAPPTSGQAPARHGETIDLKGTKAYLSIPAGPGPHPGILVIHEWWGLNENIEHWADRLASAGWAALAIDLYGGHVATTPDDAMATMKAVDEAKASGIVSAGLEYLANDPRIKAPKRAVIGWCFGGGWSLQTGLAHHEIDGVIMYYGQLETDPAMLAGIKNLLGIFGTKDKGIPPEEVGKFDAALSSANVKHQIKEYEAEHAFANPSNPHYEEASASDAWQHVLAFLQAL